MSKRQVQIRALCSLPSSKEQNGDCPILSMAHEVQSRSFLISSFQALSN